MQTPQANATDIDPFSDEYIEFPYRFHRRLREVGPIAWLDKLGVWAVARFEAVRNVLAKPDQFISSAGVGLEHLGFQRSWRDPSLLLETDPPDHTRHRAVVTRVLSPRALNHLRAHFEVEAKAFVRALVGVGTFDAVGTLAEAFPLKVFGDAVGLLPENRKHIVAWGNMVFNTMGPQNELYLNSFANARSVFAWVTAACQRQNLALDGLGAQFYVAMDAGLVSEQEASLHVGSLVSAGVDTTTNAIANLLACLADHPEQWRRLRSDPGLVKSTIEESLRFDSPFQTFFRTAAYDCTCEGISIKKDQKILLSIGSANRDPLRWERPDVFDITRNSAGHLAFGAGIHGCVGQTIARMELNALTSALVELVSVIETTGASKRMLHNTLRGFDSLPIALRA